jgi:alanine-synthesizing transaminase
LSENDVANRSTGRPVKFSARSANPAVTAAPVVLAMEEARRRGDILHDLTLTDPTGWEERADLERKALSFLSREEARRYDPQSSGLLCARKALSRKFGGAPETWILCASTSESYSILFQLLADPGEKIAVCRPSYPLLDDLARHGGLGLVDIPLRWMDYRWHLDLGWAERRLQDPAVRALVLIQPGNPTGWWLSSLEREKVLALCRKYSKALICDEVFSGDLHASGFQSLQGEDSCLVFVLGGLSKSLGLPQFKLGWIRASGPVGLLDGAFERLARLNDSLLSASTPVQLALEDLLALQEPLHDPIRRRCIQNLEVLQNLATGSLELLPAGGGWTRVLRLGGHLELETCHRLLEKGVLVQPGFLFDLPGENLVVSLLSDVVSFSTGLSIIKSVL